MKASKFSDALLRSGGAHDQLSNPEQWTQASRLIKFSLILQSRENIAI
ncbi:hypothetical protein [Roseovarius spongiae]|nr:hypothetical protein [Roseovarius spongiae]